MLMKRNALVLTLVFTLIASAAGGAIIFHRTRADPYIPPKQPPQAIESTATEHMMRQTFAKTATCTPLRVTFRAPSSSNETA
jgi:hypothetical protein